jgi:hypothetical protein
MASRHIKSYVLSTQFSASQRFSPKQLPYCAHTRGKAASMWQVRNSHVRHRALLDLQVQDFIRLNIVAV